MTRCLAGRYEGRKVQLEASQWEALHALTRATGRTLESFYREAVDAVLERHQGGRDGNQQRTA